jgi:hypothetical protein
MSVPWGFYPEDGYVVIELPGMAFGNCISPDEAQELHDTIKADPAAFLAELQAAVDEARKQRGQG